MKKIFIFMIMTFLVIGIANAASDIDSGKDETVAAGSDGEGQGDAGKIGEPKTQLQGDGQFTSESGKLMRFSEEGGQIRLQAGEHSAECKGCELTQEDGKLKAKMSNGANAEIKVMPDQANEKALERLRLKSCENCSIELKEVGKGDDMKMAYEVKTQKKAKVFGIFNADMKVEAQVDAETGEVIKSKKPWWAFLASEKSE
ncbi:hypothetical protein KAS08_01105 [Candidatus Pacearchaeota archaeon]|nr:hypothetical protein [Candidatus Pacearchaeota archaeon]